MPGRNFTDSEEQQISILYKAGHSARAIARAYGKGHHISIVAALRRQGIKQRSPAERNRKYKLNPRVFDSIDNERAAYWLGFLYADGCISRRSLQVGLKHSDGNHLEKLKVFLESEAPVKKTMVDDGTGNKHPRALLLVTDKHLADRLRELGIVTWRPSFKPITDNVPSELYHHLIRGIFDGDGGAHKPHSSRGGMLSFCGSKEMLLWLRFIMSKRAQTNPLLKISKHSKSDIYYLRFSGNLQVAQVAAFLYQGATVWLERKREVISSYPDPIPLKRDKRGRFMARPA